ncbi:aldehyde dehydrogenase family protein [Mycobacterium sp. SMC-2]|nr:aldehyde dehydrogenase family protein [Mycobacterium sp. SMC-2]UXA06212.1 aldehyde dehydrogenase family protein [Mycobacterium sp. SMC-2]
MTVTLTEAEKRLRPGRMLIGEEWVAQGSGGEFVHIDPSTGRPHPPIAMAGPADVDRAVAAARAAFAGWRSMPADARRELLLRVASLIRDHAQELGVLMSLDNGTPQSTAVIFPLAAADNFAYFGGWADKVGGDVIPTWPASALDYAVMEPYGVVGVIIPWNAVMHNIGQVVGAALAAGNCVLLKAPELAPFAALRFGELMVEAGIPPGVVNIVAGGPQCGQAMVAHPGIDKIHFIGSGATAKRIIASAAETLKPVTIELGGKSANLLFADADLQAASWNAAFLCMTNAGQGCLLPTRLLVEDTVYDEVVDMVVEAARSLAVGDPFDPGTLIGPVITAAACERILGIIEKSKSDGAGKLVTGGSRIGADLADGYFIEPTVFADVDHASDLAQLEVFGPVLSIIRFGDEAEAVRLANDTQYGLTAYLNTNDLRRAHRVAAALEAGQVYVNGFIGVPTGAPFGGVKQSGFGRMGGKWGLEDFLRPKNVYIPLV